MLKGQAGLLLFKNISLKGRLESGLQDLGICVVGCRDLQPFFKAFEKDNFHFVMIEGDLAVANNCQVIHKVRSLPNHGIVPVLVLGDPANHDHFRQVIEAGGDRFLDHSIELESLQLEILSVLRRSQSFHTEPEEMDFGDVKIRKDRQQVWVRGSKIHLTRVEFKILVELLTKRGEVISREVLSQRYLSLRNSSNRTLDVHINALRRKLGHLGESLTTVRGRGYSFRSSEGSVK